MGLDELLSLAKSGAGAAAFGAGSAAFPVLPAIEGGMEIVGSIIKSHQAKKLKEKLDTPDPRLMQFMSEIDRQRKSFETGSAYGQEMKELKNQEAATQMGIIRAARGNTGSALQAIEQVGLNTALGYGKIAAQGQERQDRYTQMYGDLVSRLEQRKYEENAYDFQQKQADARDSKIKGLQTLLNTGALGQSSFGSQNIMNILKKLMMQQGMQESNSNIQNASQLTPDQMYDLPDKNQVTGLS